MTGGNDGAPEADRAIQDAQAAAAAAAHARAQTRQVMGRVADTEEKVAATMDELAERHPDRAGRLRALSDAARRQAVLLRQWIDDHADQPPRGTAPH